MEKMGTFSDRARKKAKTEDKNNAKKEFAVHQCGPCGEHDGFHSARGCIRAGSGCGVKPADGGE